MGLYFLTFCVVDSDAFLQYFSFRCFVAPVSDCLLDFVVTLNDYSHDSVDPRLLNFHLHSELPDSGVFPDEEVQQAVAVDLHVRMNMDITRSRDLDVLCLLERCPWSADGGED